MGAAIRAFLAPILANIKLAAIAMVIAALAFTAWKIFQAGGDAVTTKNEKENQDAISDADLAALGADDCLAARAAGKRVRFDFDTGKCVRSGAGGEPE